MKTFSFQEQVNISKEYEDKLKNKVIKTAYFKRVNGIKSADFTEDFFNHLLAYDRYEFFPNTDLGFFYDVGEIFAHSKGAPSFKGSGLYNYLENNDGFENSLTSVVEGAYKAIHSSKISRKKIRDSKR